MDCMAVCVCVKRGWNPLVSGYLARCATKEFPPVAANDVANCNEVSCPIVEGSDRAMTDATVDFGGVRGSGFDDLFHWIERGFHRSVVCVCGLGHFNQLGKFVPVGTIRRGHAKKRAAISSGVRLKSVHHTKSSASG